MCYYYNEIGQQPHLFRTLYDSEYDHIKAVAEQIMMHNPRRIILTGCGDAYSNAMLCKEYMCRLTSFFIVCDEPFNIVNNPVETLSEQDVLIVFSAKGRSKMIVELLESANESKTITVCITNDINSQAARLSDMIIPVHAGEWKAPRTKVITLSALASLLLSLAISMINDKTVKELIDELINLSIKVKNEAYVWRDYTKFANESNAFTFVGYGDNYPAAYYAKAKTKEVLRWRSDIYHVEEFAHIETVAPSPGQITVFLANNCKQKQRVLSIIEAAKQMQRDIIIIAPKSLIEEYRNKAYYAKYVVLPDASGFVLPILFYIAIQLLHYNTASIKNIDPDNPPTRELARMVAFNE